MKVFLERCESYKDVKPVIEKGFESLGGIDNFVREGETLLLKPNLLRGADPKKVVNTHPDFIIAVIKILEEKNVDILVGDSPGGPMKKSLLKRAYSNAKWDRIEEETDARLNYDTSKYPIDFPPGDVLKSIDTVGFIHDVDGIINLPKLKTHMFTVYTGAVKNMFGCVHGLSKSAYHAQFRSLKDFGKMLNDVNNSLNPRISIMDGIYGMQGSGPSGGDPVKLDLLAMSSSSSALDEAVCRSVGIPIKKVKTIEHDEGITYPRLNPDDSGKNIDYPKGGTTPWYIPSALTNFFYKLLNKRPNLYQNRCIKCAKCEEICPKDAITMNPYAEISWNDCIRCYCCAEICPEDALRKE